MSPWVLRTDALGTALPATLSPQDSNDVAIPFARCSG